MQICSAQHYYNAQLTLLQLQRLSECEDMNVAILQERSLEFATGVWQKTTTSLFVRSLAIERQTYKKHHIIH